MILEQYMTCKKLSQTVHSGQSVPQALSIKPMTFENPTVEDQSVSNLLQRQTSI